MNKMEREAEKAKSPKSNVSKWLTREKFRKFFTTENLATVIIMVLNTWFFLFFFEGILLAVFTRLYFLGIYDIVFWQVGAISAYILNLYLLYKNKYYRIVQIGLIAVFSTVALIILSQIEYLMMLKVVVSIFLILSALGLVLSIKFFELTRSGFDKKSIFIIISLVSALLCSGAFLTMPKREIIITPKSNPELIFFIQPTQLPNSQDTYSSWGNDTFSFMPSIGPWNLNDSNVMDRIKLAINNSVNLYINLIPRPADFGHVGNAYKYYHHYLEFREWFENESILDSPYIKAFTIDAEPPQESQEDIDEGDIFDGINNLLEEYPSEDEIKNATDGLQKFIDAVHADGKEAGIIRTRPNLDETDGDGDIELISKNVYSLDLKWDFSVTMLYRSQQIKESEEGSALDFTTNLLLEVYGGDRTNDAFVYSRLYFYLFAGIQQSKSEINTENQYIFLGNYRDIFEGVSYIENEEFLYDLDICRHFEEEKVFLYNYEGFIYHYGVDGLIELAEHNSQEKSWKLTFSSSEIQANVILLMSLVFLDRILSLDPRYFEGNLNITI